MSSRRQQTQNRIRGPHSALTDFLAANNISAAEIRDSYSRRLRQAEEDAERRRENGEEEEEEEDPEAEEVISRLEEVRAERRRREQRAAREKQKVKDKKSKEKEKARKKKSAAAAKKRKRNSKRGALSSSSTSESNSDGSESDFSDVLPVKKKPLPGQFANCEICEKRFTVTPYSKTGPDGGLLCTPCGKQMDKDIKKESKSAGQKPPAKRRRNFESERMDGIVRPGAKSLVQLCIEKVLKHHQDIESFDNMPEHLILRICRLFTKHKVLNDTTLHLFLRGDMREVQIYDCAYLKAQDYNMIFASVPSLTKLTLWNAYQLKDGSIDYMIDKANDLQDLRIYAANLVTSEKWSEFFRRRGENLKTIKLKWLDAWFTDDQVYDLVKNCPNVNRLKLELIWNLTTECLGMIARMKKLEHLSLMFHPDKEILNEDLIKLIESVGPGLQTLSLRRFPDLDDDVLWAIRTNCTGLKKLRITATDTATDKGWMKLFHEWINPPLSYIDLSAVRDVDNQRPDGPVEEDGEEPVGLGIHGFKALMKHSGAKLKVLDIASCRHISLAALLDVFGVTTVDSVIYPNLEFIDLSFMTEVDDVVLAGLTRSAPKLKRVLLFGNFKIGREVVAPKGVVMIGPPRVLDEGMEFYGNEDVGDEIPDHIKEAMEKEMGSYIDDAVEAMEID